MSNLNAEDSTLSTKKSFIISQIVSGVRERQRQQSEAEAVMLEAIIPHLARKAALVDSIAQALTKIHTELQNGTKIDVPKALQLIIDHIRQKKSTTQDEQQSWRLMKSGANEQVQIVPRGSISS